MTGVKGKSGSGGKREGAGCPPKENKKLHMTIRIDYDLIEYVKTKENKSSIISQCIRKEKEREQ